MKIGVKQRYEDCSERVTVDRLFTQQHFHLYDIFHTVFGWKIFRRSRSSFVWTRSQFFFSFLFFALTIWGLNGHQSGTVGREIKKRQNRTYTGKTRDREFLIPIFLTRNVPDPSYRRSSSISSVVRPLKINWAKIHARWWRDGENKRMKRVCLVYD